MQTAVRHGWRAGYDAIVVGLGDQPLVPAQTWQTIAQSDGPLVSAVMDGHRSPPMRIDKDLWPLLPTTGDEGARAQNSKPAIKSRMEHLFNRKPR